MKRVWLIATASMIALAACSSGGGGSTADSPAEAGEEAPFELDAEPEATTEVEAAKSYRFEPQVIEVGVGDEVTWTNNDDFPHNVTFLTGKDDQHDLPIGKTVEVTFDESGDFYYECSIHPQTMRGLVIVAG